jgi:hypothetical protein
MARRNERNGDLSAETAAVLAAVDRATDRAVRVHEFKALPLVCYRNGRVVHLKPEELRRYEKATQPAGS